jgi:hypothetical protein
VPSRVGILLASWLTLQLRIGTLPAGMTLRHLVVLGVVAGVGFTMALFVAQLAFTNPSLLAAAKLGVLAASGGAAVLGLVLGRLLLAPVAAAGAAQTADEAESSTRHDDAVFRPRQRSGAVAARGCRGAGGILAPALFSSAVAPSTTSQWV